MSKLVHRNFMVKVDQDQELVSLAGEVQQALGKRISISRIVREALDAGLPQVRRRYLELAQRAKGENDVVAGE